MLCFTSYGTTTDAAYTPHGDDDVIQDIEKARPDKMQLTPLTGTMTRTALPLACGASDAAYTPHGDDDTLLV